MCVSFRQLAVQFRLRIHLSLDASLALQILVCLVLCAHSLFDGLDLEDNSPATLFSRRAFFLARYGLEQLFSIPGRSGMVLV